VISRNLSRRVDQLERRAKPAKKWMIVLGRPLLRQTDQLQPQQNDSEEQTLTIVLPRVA